LDDDGEEAVEQRNWDKGGSDLEETAEPSVHQHVLQLPSNVLQDDSEFRVD